MWIPLRINMLTFAHHQERLRQRALQQESKDELDGSNDDSSHDDSDSPVLERYQWVDWRHVEWLFADT